MNTLDKVYTHYYVDQFPELDDFPVQDQVMDKFRLFFPLPLATAIVSPNGKEMRYRLLSEQGLNRFLQTARDVIAVHHLPLEASIMRRDGVTSFENQLVIAYTGRRYI
jgi:hypothetical protein